MEHGFDPRLVADLLDPAEHVDVPMTGPQAARQVELVRARRAVQPQAAHHPVVREDGRPDALVLVGDHPVGAEEGLDPASHE